MLKGFKQIALLTALSRIFGLIRDIAYSHLLGAGGLFDAWVIAFKIPNLSRRIFGEGSASASLIPIYSQALAKDKKQANDYICTFITVVCALLAAIVLVSQIGIWVYYKFFATTNETKLVLALANAMLPYMLFICAVALIAGVLNVHRHFAAPAAAPIILNLCIIAAAIIYSTFFKSKQGLQLTLLAISVLTAGILQILLQLIPLKRTSVSLRFSWQIKSEYFKKTLLLMGPMIIGLTATQLNTLSDDLIAWWFSASQEKGEFFMFMSKAVSFPMQRGSVSHLYYSQRLYQLPLGVLGISLATAIFPVMSAKAAAGDTKALARIINKGIRATIFVAVPATVGLIMTAKPLIRVALQHGEFTSTDTPLVYRALVFYCLGLCGYFSQQILARAFYSMQDSKTPTYSAIIAVCINIILNLTLIWRLGTAGLACATAVCSYLQVAFLITILTKKFGKDILQNIGKIALKTAIGTILMTTICLIILYIMAALPSSRLYDLLRLVIIVPAAAISYTYTAKILKTQELTLLFNKNSDNTL